MEKSKEFSEQLKSLKEYWAQAEPNNVNEALDGFLFSVLSMIDGVSGFNHFHSLVIADAETGDILNANVTLHEEYFD